MGLNFLGKAAVRRSLLTVAALGGIFVGVSVFTFYYAEGEAIDYARQGYAKLATVNVATKQITRR